MAAKKSQLDFTARIKEPITLSEKTSALISTVTGSSKRCVQQIRKITRVNKIVHLITEISTATWKY